MSLPADSQDDTSHVVAWLFAGQATCLAAGFGLGAMWLSSSWSGWMLTGGVLSVAAMQAITLWAGQKRLHAVARFRQQQAERQAEHDRAELHRTQQAVMFGLAHLSESRDPATGQHLRRMKHFTRKLAEALQDHPHYQAIVTDEFVKQIEISAMLHDIGKVGISDEILLKPGKLTTDERHEMQQHPIISSQCLRQIEERLGSSNFLQMAHEIALYHHERWDGRGYPFGRRGEAIPLAARIVSIADVYDALSSERVYKPAFPHEQCVSMIREAAGTQFDPDLVNVFVSIEHRFRDVSERVRSNDPSLSMMSFTMPADPNFDPDEQVESDIQSSLSDLDDLLGSLELETSPKASQLASMQPSF